EIATGFPIIAGKRIFNFQCFFDSATSESEDAANLLTGLPIASSRVFPSASSPVRSWHPASLFEARTQKLEVLRIPGRIQQEAQLHNKVSGVHLLLLKIGHQVISTWDQCLSNGRRNMSSLPLIERAREDGFTFVMSASAVAEEQLYQIATTAPAPRIPRRDLQPGEQYRFHFDMTQCIGCKCCVVACNEQNGNPANINWRRVGEIEGGFYPNTQRLHISMGCNHCLEPSCLIGCPVEAYKKDPVTGIVQHNPETCIGCQYCTWNCSYGVPQYNAERGVVGKCDMCYGRLTDGREPAC